MAIASGSLVTASAESICEERPLQQINQTDDKKGASSSPAYIPGGLQDLCSMRRGGSLPSGSSIGQAKQESAAGRSEVGRRIALPSAVDAGRLQRIPSPTREGWGRATISQDDSLIGRRLTNAMAGESDASRTAQLALSYGQKLCDDFNLSGNRGLISPSKKLGSGADASVYSTDYSKDLAIRITHTHDRLPSSNRAEVLIPVEFDKRPISNAIMRRTSPAGTPKNIGHAAEQVIAENERVGVPLAVLVPKNDKHAQIYAETKEKLSLTDALRMTNPRREGGALVSVLRRCDGETVSDSLAEKFSKTFATDGSQRSRVLSKLLSADMSEKSNILEQCRVGRFQEIQGLSPDNQKRFERDHADLSEEIVRKSEGIATREQGFYDDIATLARALLQAGKTLDFSNPNNLSFDKKSGRLIIYDLGNYEKHMRTSDDYDDERHVSASGLELKESRPDNINGFLRCLTPQVEMFGAQVPMKDVLARASDVKRIERAEKQIVDNLARAFEKKGLKPQRPHEMPEAPR
jgi:hypothetical protein